MLHKSAMSEGIDLGLGGFLRHRKNELCVAFYFRLLVVFAYQVEVAAACRIYIMNHAACLSRLLLDAFEVRREEKEEFI